MRIPWAPLISAILLLLPLLRQPLDQLILTLVQFICRVFGPDTLGKGEGLTDLMVVVAKWLSNKASDLHKTHELSIGKFVGGFVMATLFAAAAAIEATLMKSAIEIILPVSDESISLFDVILISAPLALALSVLMFEAGVATVFLEATHITSMFHWKQSWTPARCKVVATLSGLTLLALIVVQCFLANLRIEEAGLSSLFNSIQSLDSGDAGNISLEGTAPDASSETGRVVGIILSAMIPLFAVAGGYGLHQILLGATTLTISFCSGVAYVGAGGAWLTATATQWGGKASSIVINIAALPGKWVIEATDRIISIAWHKQ